MTERPGRAALAFFAAFFLLFASGRIASQDAGEQLQVSLSLALTGRVSDDSLDGGLATAGWVRGPGGRYYQAHDLGNVVLMLPAAWLGAVVSGTAPEAAVLDPPVASRVGAALSCSLVAALGCWWLFRLFALFHPTRTAFGLALLLPCATIFMAYARTGWDVLGGCVFVCASLFYATAATQGVAPRRNVVLAGAMLALACSFRFSLAPFLVPAVGALFLSARRSLPTPALVGSAALFLALMTPSLVYNATRTGSTLRPATASTQYLEGPNALTGDLAHGLFGLLLSPNRGLFVFCPILFFAFAASLRDTPGLRRTLWCLGTGAVAYTVLIARMSNWGAFGWGPRYLLPVLPVLFVPAALGVARAASRHKALTIAAVAACVVLTVPAAVVNWHLASTATEGAARADASLPIQQYVAWKALADGMRGQSLPLPSGVTDTRRATTAAFPDLFIVRLARQSREGLAAATFVSLGLLVALAWSVSVLLRRQPDSPVTPIRAHA